MNQETLIFFAPVIAVLLINIFMLIGILATAYAWWRKLASAKKEAEQIISFAEKEALLLKEVAGKRADQILSAAESAALNIIQKSNSLGIQFQESLKAEFEKAIDRQIEGYKVTIQSLENKSERTIKRYLGKFEKALEQDEIKEHEEIERELQKHRDQKIAEMDEYARKTFPEIISSAVGDALTKEQHEALVFSALKKLKETNFFQHE